MPKAIYEQIYRELKSRIESGFYPPQELLPSENKLIVEFDCSRGTLRRAVAELVRAGYVQTMQGKGVRCIFQPSGQATFTLGGIESFAESAARNHWRGTSTILCFMPSRPTSRWRGAPGSQSARRSIICAVCTI